MIGTDKCNDITSNRRVRAGEALFNCRKSEIYRPVEEPDRAAYRAHACHLCRKWIYVFFRAARGMKPNLSRLASNDRNFARDLNPLGDQPCHSKPPLSSER